MTRKSSQRRKQEREYGYHRFVSGKKPFCMALIVVAVLGVFVYCRVTYVQAVESSYEEQERQLQQQIEEQERRSQELADYEAYMDTMEFIEDMAESRLGMIHKGEVIFRSTQE